MLDRKGVVQFPDGNAIGSAYRFHFDGTAWTEEIVRAATTTVGNELGSSLAVDAGLIVPLPDEAPASFRSAAWQDLHGLREAPVPCAGERAAVDAGAKS